MPKRAAFLGHEELRDFQISPVELMNGWEHIQWLAGRMFGWRVRVCADHLFATSLCSSCCSALTGWRASSSSSSSFWAQRVPRGIW